MSIVYVDSSALVKRYRNEVGSGRVSELLQRAEQLLIARLTMVEVSSALVRRARATGMEVNNLRTTLAAFDEDLARSFDLIELDELVMERAVGVARQYGLRGADAIQLACVLLARNQMPSEIILLSSDTELNAAALLEGLKVENPEPM